MSLADMKKARDPSRVKVVHISVPGFAGGPALKRFDETILDFRNIERLTLAENRIRALPGNIARLKKLRMLNLSYNPLESVPGELKNLEELNLFNVSKLDWDSLFETLAELPKLGSLSLG